ncbi:MAG: hypothetical protein KJ057_13065 [Phycisphaerae bacterium]|nr:hypothetical protein [Planctomycetia bacterium]MCL4719395.1 hypothetical protein [Phycisphaerae bacterium]
MNEPNLKDRFRGLPPPHQRLLRMLQDVNFGRITFCVQGGAPDFEQPWRTRQTVKLAGGTNGPRPETSLSDFELRQEQAALLEALGRLRDGADVTVEVRHGLPFLVEIEQEQQLA